MSASNGVIRIGRKGIKKFAFGEDGAPFEVDVVAAFQRWCCIDDTFRDDENDRKIPVERMPEYHQAAVGFVAELQLANIPAGYEESSPVSIAEALDFIARLREQYDELADFFLPRKRVEDESPATSEVGLRFSVEGEPSPTSTN